MWYVYILSCSDKTLYTGVTNNILKRITQHNTGTGAKYTKGRAPVKVVHTEEFPDRSSAQKRESEIKKFSLKKKIDLIQLD